MEYGETLHKVFASSSRYLDGKNSFMLLLSAEEKDGRDSFARALLLCKLDAKESNVFQACGLVIRGGDTAKSNKQNASDRLNKRKH